MAALILLIGGLLILLELLDLARKLSAPTSSSPRQVAPAPRPEIPEGGYGYSDLHPGRDFDKDMTTCLETWTRPSPKKGKTQKQLPDGLKTIFVRDFPKQLPGE